MVSKSGLADSAQIIDYKHGCERGGENLGTAVD